MLINNHDELSWKIKQYQSMGFRYYNEPVNELQRLANRRCLIVLLPFLNRIRDDGIDPRPIGVKCLNPEQYNNLVDAGLFLESKRGV